MPTNKEALIRYRVINRCLTGGQYATKAELITACENTLEVSPIGERTIDQDISDMRNDSRLGYFAPIVFDRTIMAYKYDDPNYSIDNIPLNDDDFQALHFAAQLLEQYSKIDIFRQSEGAIQKIMSTIKVRRLMSDMNANNLVEFEQIPNTKGYDLLQFMHDAAYNKKVISFDYKRFGEEAVHTHTLHPYLLKEYRNRWYVVGLHEYFNEIRTYGLDRISNAEIDYSKSFRKTDFDPQKHFCDVVGITAPAEEPIDIEIEFTQTQAEYVLAQPIHKTQEIISHDNNKLILKVHIIPTFEFYSTILGWGPAVKILSPKHVQEELVKILKGSLGRY